MRVVSLIASSTEIVCALGFEQLLVGRSHECDYPASVKALPAVTAPKFRLDGTSYEIDNRLKAILEQGLSVYRVDAEALDRLKPDVIITQVQCEVCAVSARDVVEAVGKLVGSRPKVVSLNPNKLSDIWADIRSVAAALGAPAKGDALIARLEERIRKINDTASRQPRPSVAYIEWIEPLMTGGNWMPELVELAGGRNLFGVAGKHSPLLEWQRLVEANPDVIFVAPCGFDIERTRSEMKSLTGKKEWKDLWAGLSGRVYLGDGNQYFNRPGPRVVESLETLAETLHPEIFQFGHEGPGWQRF